MYAGEPTTVVIMLSSYWLFLANPKSPIFSFSSLTKLLSGLMSLNYNKNTCEWCQIWTWLQIHWGVGWDTWWFNFKLKVVCFSFSIWEYLLMILCWQFIGRDRNYIWFSWRRRSRWYWWTWVSSWFWFISRRHFSCISRTGLWGWWNKYFVIYRWFWQRLTRHFRCWCLGRLLRSYLCQVSRSGQRRICLFFFCQFFSLNKIDLY